VLSVGGGDKSTDRIVRIAQGTEPGYTPTGSQPFGLSPEQAYQEGKNYSRPISTSSTSSRFISSR
jgi:hypothetical protein